MKRSTPNRAIDHHSALTYFAFLICCEISSYYFIPFLFLDQSREYFKVLTIDALSPVCIRETSSLALSFTLVDSYEKSEVEISGYTQKRHNIAIES